MSTRQENTSTATGGAGVGPTRRKWDKEEFTAKARDRDNEDRERAKENEERLSKGKKPLQRRREDLPKPTESMRQRDAPLELDKNLGKAVMVENVGGSKGPGFYCELCNRTCKDSMGYLDHINGRMHLRRLGQTTQVARSTIEQVRTRITMLRAKTAERTQARAYDFDERLRALADEQRAERDARRQHRKEARKIAVKKQQPPSAESGNVDVMAAMGFGTFGSSKGK